MSSITFNRTDVVLPNTARIASLDAPDQRNKLQRGMILVFDITAVPGGDTVLLTIEGKDPISGEYYTILAGAAQVAQATLVMRVYPALVAIANLTANDILPDTWRPTVTHSGAGSFEYSVAASYVR